MKKLRVGAGRGRRRQKGRALEHREDMEVYFVGSRKQQGFFWVWRLVPGRELDVVVREGRSWVSEGRC